MSHGEPPQDLHAERSLLGGLLQSNVEIDNVQGLVSSADFYRMPHQLIYDTMLMLRMDGKPADPVTMVNELARSGDLLRIGGGEYLLDMIQECPSAVNAVYYAEIVADKAILRRLQEAGVRIIQMAENGHQGADAMGVVEQAWNELEKLVSHRRGNVVAESVDMVSAFMDLMESPAAPAMSTGIPALDKALDGGFRPGTMIVVGARPGVGKSLLLQQFTQAAAEAGHGAMFISMEMSETELMERFLARESEIPLTSIRRRQLHREQKRLLAAAGQRIAKLPLAVVDLSHVSLSLIAARARERQRTARGLAMIAVDYVQLMTVGNPRSTRQEQVAENSRGLKRIARDLQVPVVVAAQLNRGPEGRIDKKPEMSDLRETGSLEQDADVVILLNPDPTDDRVMELIIAKHRQGRTGKVTVPLATEFSQIGCVNA
jgi:replicative DNA helicase